MTSSVSIPTGLASSFNATALVNFVATDKQVGNWSIQVNIVDTGSPSLTDFRVFSFFVNNINDAVRLHTLGSVDAYTSNNYSIEINASDDDLLIPDKNVYNEILSFSSNTSWVSVIPAGVIPGTNITKARVEFDPNDAPGSGLHQVNITVIDANSYSLDSKILTINVIGNFKPTWQNPATTHVLIEDGAFYLNLSENVSDPDGDPISFNFISDTSFPSFSLDAVGVIDFIPKDEDIGQHILVINATDGITPTSLIFNFTIYNINDGPFIQEPLQGNNVTIDAGSNIIASEDGFVDLFLFAIDDDLKIPAGQKAFYDENINLDLTIEGPNTDLFEFSTQTFLPPNRSIFGASFSPGKTDVGFYNVTIDITDSGSLQDSITFNLTVLEINHAPFLVNLTDQASTINRTLYYDIDSFDLEEGLDTSGSLTYSYKFLNDGKTEDFIRNDQTIFNRTSGVLNVTFNDTQGGSYHINLTVNDSFGLASHGDFWIFVYDLPIILSPSSNFVFNLKEGNASSLTFVANSSGLANLSYQFYIGNNLRFNTIYYGNGTPLKWNAVPEFEDETYGFFGNLTLNVLIPNFEYLNSSRTWNANITHGNAPVKFIKNIGDKQGVYGKDIVINLSEYFYDADYLDIHYNQSVIFSAVSNMNTSAIGYSFNGWDMMLSASSAVIETFNITASDLNGSVVLTSARSNNFQVEFIEPIILPVPVPEPVPVPVPSGGGGGSTTEKLVSLKIILPEPVSAKRGETIILPIQVFNDGTTPLTDINLGSFIVKDGRERDEINVSLSREHIASLPSGAREELTLTAYIGNELGLFEITVNATVEDPKYYDWGKIFINYEEGETVVERLVFTEEFIVENPECAEVKELVDESREFLAAGDFDSANDKLNEAVDACKEAISKNSLFSGTRLKVKFQDKIFIYLLIATVLSVGLGIAYYAYRRKTLKNALEEVSKMSFEKV